jgi:hypothetical protein
MPRSPRRSMKPKWNWRAWTARQDDWVGVLSALGLFTLHEEADWRGCGGQIGQYHHTSESCRRLISAFMILMVYHTPSMSPDPTSF